MGLSKYLLVGILIFALIIGGGAASATINTAGSGNGAVFLDSSAVMRDNDSVTSTMLKDSYLLGHGMMTFGSTLFVSPDGIDGELGVELTSGKAYMSDFSMVEGFTKPVNTTPSGISFSQDSFCIFPEDEPSELPADEECEYCKFMSSEVSSDIIGKGTFASTISTKPVTSIGSITHQMAFIGEGGVDTTAGIKSMMGTTNTTITGFTDFKDRAFMSGKNLNFAREVTFSFD